LKFTNADAVGVCMGFSVGGGVIHLENNVTYISTECLLFVGV
jgi:hypothetical protein